MRTGAIVVACVAVVAVVAVRVVDGAGSSPSTPVAADDADGDAATPGEPVSEPSSGELPPDSLPPDDGEALAAVFDPVLEPLGLRLTRGGLGDSPGAAEDESLRGRHLALYVEPLSADHAPADYLDTLVTSARVFLPEVFEEWPGLASMDVCQEPPPGVDDRPVPPPVTVLDMTRAQAAQLDWATVDLPGLLEARDAELVRLFVDEEIGAHPDFVEAEA